MLLLKIRRILIRPYVFVMGFLTRKNDTFLKAVLEYYQYSPDAYRFIKAVHAHHPNKKAPTIKEFEQTVFDFLTVGSHPGKITAFDLGAYHGEWAQMIDSKYSAQIYMFEPNIRSYNKITNRFKDRDNFHAFNFGLSDNTCSARLTLSGMGSSIFDANPYGAQNDDIKIIDAKFVDMVDFIKQHGIEKIDIIKINIEGGEYDLLERLLETGDIKRLKELQIQFHNWLPDAYSRRKKIRETLSKTHTNIFNYSFIWEKWILKSEIH